MQAILQQLNSKRIEQLVKSPLFGLWLVRGVNLLAIILLASVLAKLSWMLLSGNQSASGPVSTKRNVARVEPAVRLRSISNLSLFGKADVPVVQDAPIVAPETRLQLKLKGVFASSDPERAFAIISDSKNHDKAYRLGSKVSGGAVLHAVYVDRVILKRNGRLETLRMATTYNGSAAKSGNRSQQTQRRPVMNANSTINKRKVHATPKLKQLKKTLKKDPQKIWQQVRVSPVLKDGSIKGYTLEHQDKELMRSLTLQKGDVITAVNGKALSDPSTLYGLMNQLTSAKSFDVTIERNGQLQTIQLQL